MKIYSNQKLLDDQIIKKFVMSWNEFPNYVSKELLHCFKSNSAIPSGNSSIEKNDIPEIIFCLPYTRKKVNSFWSFVWRKLNVVQIETLNLECNLP